MTQIQAGFILPKIQSIVLTNKEFEKYNISAADKKKVDTNKDGKITANEFLASGLGVPSIFQAYVAKAKSNGAYVNETNKSNGTNKTTQQANANANVTQNKYNLSHPNVTSPIIANTVDYRA